MFLLVHKIYYHEKERVYFGVIKEQIQLIKEKDPSIHSTFEAILTPGFRALLYYQISHYFYLKKHFFIARYLCERAKRKTGIEIHPGAVIGKRLFIDHGTGIVIGETSIIGDDVTIFHGVTLGSTGKEVGKRHPTVRNCAIIGAGAKILGNISIGEYAKIGANAVILENVPSFATVVGIPGKITKKEEHSCK